MGWEIIYKILALLPPWILSLSVAAGVVVAGFEFRYRAKKLQSDKKFDTAVNLLVKLRELNGEIRRSRNPIMRFASCGTPSKIIENVTKIYIAFEKERFLAEIIFDKKVKEKIHLLNDYILELQYALYGEIKFQEEGGNDSQRGQGEKERMIKVYSNGKDNDEYSKKLYGLFDDLEDMLKKQGGLEIG